MNAMANCAARRGGPTRGWRGRRVVMVLLLSTLIGSAACLAVGSPSPRHPLVLALPGAGLADLTRADLPHLAGLAHGSLAAWVAAWPPVGLPPGYALRLSVSLRRDPRRPF